MSWTQILFSFRGRLNRAKYWFVVLGFFVISLAIALALLPVIEAGSSENALLSFLVIMTIVYIPLTYIGLAISVKRLHDRNKSGWWLLLFCFVPAILGAMGDQSAGSAISSADSGISLAFYAGAAAIGIWALVELGFLRGTIGANDYGPDPVG